MNIKEKLISKPKVILVIVRKDGTTEVREAENLITTAGLTYYAQVAAGETPDVDFTAGYLRLGDGESVTPTVNDTDVSSFITGSAKALRTGYPKTDDDDARNTSAGATTVTWSYAYSAGDFTGTVRELAICNSATSPTAALNHAVVASPITITSEDTLTVFVNHEFANPES